MAPLIPIAAALALVYGGYEWWRGKHPKVQTLRTTSVTPLGAPIPIKIVVPVTPTPPIVQAAVTPLHPSNTGTGASYSPPPVVASSSPGKLTLAPIVITPTGSATLGVQTVQDVQNAMNTMGFATPTLGIDGKSGPMTVAAIKAFQSKQGIPADGAITDALKTAIQGALAVMAGPGAPIGTSAVVQTATPVTPPQVAASVAATTSTPVAAVTVNTSKDVQHALNLLGASPALTEDGVVGPMSTAAIKAFQISHGLTSDGVAGPKTKTALTLALAGAAVSVPTAAVSGDARVGFGQHAYHPLVGPSGQLERGFGPHVPVDNAGNPIVEGGSGLVEQYDAYGAPVGLGPDGRRGRGRWRDHGPEGRLHDHDERGYVEPPPVEDTVDDTIPEPVEDDDTPAPPVVAPAPPIAPAVVNFPVMHGWLSGTGHEDFHREVRGHLRRFGHNDTAVHVTARPAEMGKVIQAALAPGLTARAPVAAGLHIALVSALQRHGAIPLPGRPRSPRDNVRIAMGHDIGGQKLRKLG